MSISGRFFAILGPDGTGKSTVIDELSNYMPKFLNVNKDYIKIIHFRPNLIPNISRLVISRRNKYIEQDFTVPHSARPSGYVLSMFRLFYYFLDYVIGYFVKVRPSLVKGDLVIFDRYFYDFIVDPLRSRVNLPKFIPMVLMKFIPKPTLIVFLDNDATTILQRKRELSASEIVRQISEYRSLIKILPNAISVDGRKPVAEIVERIAMEYIKRITISV
jgi:thymidylate kinase